MPITGMENWLTVEGRQLLQGRQRVVHYEDVGAREIRRRRSIPLHYKIPHPPLIQLLHKEASIPCAAP